MWWGERAAIERVDAAFVCSQDDKRYLREHMGVRKVEIIPNAVPRVEEGPLTDHDTKPRFEARDRVATGPDLSARVQELSLCTHKLSLCTHKLSLCTHKLSLADRY